MCFGDSLTWGWKPTKNGVPASRYPYEQRWTGVMMSELGAGFELIEEGLSGRNTNLDDPLDPRLNGAAYLPSALASHLPLDLVVLMLGANDTRKYFHRTAFEIAAGISVLLSQIASSSGGVSTIYPAPKTLLIAPPPVSEMPNPWFKALYSESHAKTKELSTHYKALAEFCDVPFMNAGEIISTGGIDGLHFSLENNKSLGLAVADKVKEIL